MARSKSYAVMSFEALIKIRDDVTEALADRADTLRQQLTALTGGGGKSRQPSVHKQRKAVKKAAKKAAKKVAKKAAKRAKTSPKATPKKPKKVARKRISKRTPEAATHSPPADGGTA